MNVVLEPSAMTAGSIAPVSRLLTSAIAVTASLVLAACGGGEASPVTERPAAPATVHYSDQQIEGLIAQLTSATPSVTHNSAAFRTLVSIGERAMPQLVAALRDRARNTDVRKWCALLIGKVGPFDEAMGILLSVLDDTTGLYAWWHRAEAANGLIELFRRQTAAVAKAHLAHGDARVREAAVQSFSYRDPAVRDEELMNLLITRMLIDVEPRVRRRAAAVLATRVDSRDAIAPFVQALDDPDTWVRAEAARALGRIGNRNALPALDRIAGTDVDAWVRDAAAAAAIQIRRG